jgi:methionyl-tRNA synthetase
MPKMTSADKAMITGAPRPFGKCPQCGDALAPGTQCQPCSRAKQYGAPSNAAPAQGSGSAECC